VTNVKQRTLLQATMLVGLAVLAAGQERMELVSVQRGQ
jgi:hypothetical protein